MAEQIIDKVQVEVQASAKGTSAVFEQLERRLTALQKVLNSIDTTNLQKIQKTASSTTINVNTNGISKAEKDVTKSVSKIEQALAGLQAYANAAMNGDSSSMTSFERRVISIQSQMDVLKQKFQSFGDVKIPTDAMEKLQTEMDKTSSHLDSLQKKQQQMTDSGGNPKGGITQEWIDLQIALRDTKARFDDLYAAQTKLVNEGKAFEYPLQPYKEQLSSLEAQLNQTANTVRDAYSAMNETPSINPDNSGLIDTSKEAEKAREKLKKMCDSAMQKAFDSLKSTLKKIASAITGIGKNADGAFGKGFMKILKYGFGIRSIYVAFRRLRKVVVESFQELQNSGAFVEETKSNIEDLKNSLTLLKYQFGAAFQPIFNAVAPALKTLMNNLVSVMNTISAFIAKLMGKSTYSKAVLNAAAFADNTGKAAKAQKELNKQLQGFDELNNLTTNQNNGNTGSSGKSDDIPGAVYVEESVDSVLGDFWNELAAKIEQGDWKGVGQTISDKLSSAMESIDWESIYKKASNFGTGLASFLNGLINPRLFGDVGTTLAGALNTAFAFLNSFGTTFDWKNFGESIATGINNFFTTFNFRQVGETLHTWIAGALDALITFFEKTDFEQIGKAIAEFIGGLDIPDLAKKLAKLAIKILEALADAIKGLWNNSSVTGKLAMAIIGIFAVLKLTGLAKTLGTLFSAALSGSTISIAAKGAKFVISGATLATAAEAVGSVAAVGVGDYLSTKTKHNPLDLNKDTLAQDVITSYGSLLAGSAGWSGIAGLLAKYSGGSFLGGAASAFPQIMAVLGSGMLGNFAGNSFARYWVSDPETAKYYGYDKYGSVGNPLAITKNLDALGDVVLSMFTGNFIPGVKGLGGAMAKGWTDKAEEWLTPMFEFFDPNKDYLGGTIKEIGQNVWTSVKKKGGEIKKWGKETWDLWGETMETIFTPAFDFFKRVGKTSGLNKTILDFTWNQFGGDGLNASMLSAWEGVTHSTSKVDANFKSIGETLTSLSGKTKTVVADTKAFGDESATSATKAKTGFASFATDTISTFSDAYTKGTKTWNGIGRWATTKATDASKGFDSFSGEVSGKFDDAYTQSTNKWSGISTWANDVTTKTTTGMSLLPNNVAKTFGDAYTDGTNKWNELGTWATTQGDTVDNAFNNFPTKTETQFGNAYTNGTTKWNGIGKWASDTFSKVSETSSRKLGEVASQFETNFNNGTNKAQSRVSVFSSFLNSLNLVKKTGVEADESAFQRVKNRFEGFKTSLNQNKNVTIAVEGRGFDTLGSKITSLVGQLRNLKNMSGGITLGYNTGINNFRYFAGGGVVSGATPAIVGEAGAEAILPLTDGTIGKLADMIVGDMPITNNSMTRGYGSTSDNASEIARQNELLAEQNQLLRQIAAKELTVSSKDVFYATRSEANNYYNRTGNSPFLI